jgi:pantetheine-phosphate adenylyltransferase
MEASDAAPHIAADAADKVPQIHPLMVAARLTSGKIKDRITSMTQGAHVIAVYPGSFDPITNGHLDVIERGSKLFDRLIVSILQNETKAPLFNVRERAEMLRESVRPFGNVEIDSFQGLLADYALSKNARVILRGIRAVSDYEYELQMALMNRRLQPQVETVFLLAGEAFSFISSRLVKEVISLGGNIAGLVPPLVEQRLRERLLAAQAIQNELLTT